MTHQFLTETFSDKKLLFFAKAFPCFGIWTMHTWIMWLNTNNPLSGSALHPWISPYLGQSILMIAIVLVYWGVAKTSKVGSHRLSDIAFTALGCLITLYCWASPHAQSPSLLWASSLAILLGGACLGWFYVRWGVFYSGLSLKNALGCIFTACIFGALAKTVLGILPDAIGSAFALLLPLLSTAFLRRSLTLAPPLQGAEIRYTKKSIGSLWKVMSCVAIYSLVYSFATGLPKSFDNTFDYAGVIGHAIEIGVSLFILWWTLTQKRVLSFVQLWRCILLLIGTMLVFSAYEYTAAFQSICSTSISYLVVVFLWLLLSDIAHHSNLHPFVVFAGGWISYTFPNYLGKVLSSSGVIATSMTPPVALVLLFIITLTITLFLENRDPVLQRIFSDLDESVHDPQDFALIDERCEALAASFGLTARETEVMQLLCKGRSKAYIAETLFITENTVRGHSRKLYAKLNVHSKIELQNLIGI